MNFKTVHGLGRAEYAIKAVNAALDKCVPPAHVDAWLKWFDEQPADCRDLDNFTKEQRQRMTMEEAIAANPVMLGRDDKPCLTMAGQCDKCPSPTVCPPECPENDPDFPRPEYYTGDLEEVAHAVSRVSIELAIGVIREAHPMHISTVGDIVRLLEGTLDQVQAEISKPGYVEGLLPE